MSNKSVYSDEIPTDRNQIDHHQSLQYSSANRSEFSAFGIPSGVSSYASANSMSAAAAAALLIQAAAGGSANGDSGSNASLTRRRLSTANLFESPQQSPLSPSVISAAAQQAALAVAQAKASPCSPSTSQGAPSSFQAAVLSLALAASSSCTTTTSLSDLQFQDYHRSFRGNSSVNDFINLSEHPKLLSMRSSLASALRRRSSTIAPCFVNVTNPECMDMLSPVEQKCGSNTGFNSASNIDSTNDQIINNQHLTSSDFHESSNVNGPHAASPCSYRSNVAPGFLNYGLRSEQRHQLSDPYDVDVNTDSSAKLSHHHYSMNLNSDKPHPNPPRIFSDALSQRSYEDPNIQSCYKTTKLDPTLTNSSLLHSTIDQSSSKTNQPYFSTTPTPSANEIPPNCPTSPLSCSSLSNSATPCLNISPINVDCRGKNNVMDDVSGVTSRSSISGRSLKTNCTMSGDSKVDEPSRKREQRLMKNREAARECRRKKKEYVKCLEARVSLLESQNQQLIEELQKVKALCFKELCNLGLTSSGAACAAAVLAAVTSGPSSTDTSGLNSTASFASDPDHCVHDQSGDMRRLNTDYRTTASPSDDQSHTPRTRRRSFFSGTKLSPSAPQTQWVNPYPTKCSEVSSTVTCGSSQLTHAPLIDLPDPCLPKLDEPKVDNTLPNCPINPSSIDKTQPVPNLDCMRGNLPETISPNSESSQDINRLPYRCVPSTVSPSVNWKPQQQNSNPYQHPRYAAKRAYRNANFNTDAMPYSTDLSQCPVDNKKPSNTTSDVSTVSGATMILAAAAAMAVKSESSTSESRLSV